ncbi:MAG: YqaJ viral recombinase family protein [Clostridia bacterium]|nr:YqaJ viral recombinase family protein [Clostridia bacterium]MBQ8836475.1 YqaJ viral recombinase family protein [Clostridia bacterium]
MINEIAYHSKEEWLALRKMMGIGGSDAGAVVGLNPYKSAYSLWAEKTGRVAEFEGNLTTEVGSYLEEFVAKLFERETGKRVRRKNRMLVNSDYPFAFADVDRLVVGERALLEIKTTNSIPLMKKVRQGEFPEQYYAQCVHYLAVSGLEKAYLAVLIGCRDFRIFELERDEGEISALMEAERSFWFDNVKADAPPPADGSISTSETVTALYPESNDETVSLVAYEADLRQYMTYTALIKSAEKQRDEAAGRIKAFMKMSGKGEASGFRVSFASSERRSFDAKLFAAEHPHMDLTKYYKNSTYRTFKVIEVNI